MTKRSLRQIASALGIGWLMASGTCVAAEDFYGGKPIKLIVGANVGGSYDIHARLLARFLERHIAGSPEILVQNLPGAGSMTAANYVYGVAPQDGTVLLAPIQTIVQNQLLNERGARFDAARLQWIGNPTASVNVIATWHTSSVKTFKDAFNRSAAIGVTSPSSSGGVEIALANNILGMKFKMVSGYRGFDIDIAMERGEIDGRAGQSWAGWKQTRPEWVRDGRLNVILQTGHARARDLPDVPLLTEAVDNDERRQIVALYSKGVTLGRPLAVGPGVPKQRVDVLRKAFHETMNDPRFVEEAGRLGVNVEPIYGDQLQSIVLQMLATPQDVVRKLETAANLANAGR
jgi:tripartite-type tricarboxylate transporter receptor subunit TctC